MTIKKENKANSHQNLIKILQGLLLATWVSIVIIASQYCIVYGTLFLVGKERIQQPVWVGFCQALSYILAFLLLFFVTPRLYELIQIRSKKKITVLQNMSLATSRTELGLKESPTFVDLGLPIVAYVVYLAIAQGILFIIEKVLPWFNPEQEQQTGFSHFLSSGDRFIAMLTIVLIAPVAEELIMRGWLYGKIREWLKPISAMLIVSLLFAILHGQLNVALATFVLSIILCTMREITGTIWSGILLHIIVNAISFYFLYVAF